ncbi:response regulator transcription factor [Alteribacillus bidgolensis]|uniref:DNA-binding response regulator, OmpR family, contains REC and winged-helix (WHTH) domain n=1 Tax=Alteribacillus bidgolensis TaxID=930129 RepID=A0A1G8CHW1_9BACI|nr:response regulator transcription factor [Alteribacillus bidgolensis]SDH44998.1 DNA-binding response regulator, OmpR family, contains REC and winged-helix (wHTH) domain [Alteribacillus bidgolensis]
MGKDTILVVEDEEDIRNLIQLYLQKDYTVFTSINGKDALKQIKKQKPDLVLLDILLPEMNGFEVCEKLRETDEETPVLFLSAKREFEDKIQGLELGADDYITKPFDPGEMLARVKAHLRRRHLKTNVKPKSESSRYLQFGDLSIDIEGYSVFRNGELIHLFAKEMQLLLLLAKNPHQVFSVEQLYDNVWGADRFGDLKTVSVHISKLRKKIEKNPAKPEFIITVRGFGYKFLP